MSYVVVCLPHRLFQPFQLVDGVGVGVRPQGFSHAKIRIKGKHLSPITSGHMVGGLGAP
jgi:hypothetical protein